MPFKALLGLPAPSSRSHTGHAVSFFPSSLAPANIHVINKGFAICALHPLTPHALRQPNANHSAGGKASSSGGDLGMGAVVHDLGGHDIWSRHRRDESVAQWQSVRAGTRRGEQAMEQAGHEKHDEKHDQIRSLKSTCVSAVQYGC